MVSSPFVDTMNRMYIYQALISSLSHSVALAQIMARMKLNFAANRTMEIRSRIQLSKVIFIPPIIVIFNGLLIYLMIRAYYFHLQREVFRMFLYASIIVLIVDAFVIAYFYALVIKTRRQVRYAYHIPTESHCEDTCSTICCTSCTITQMGQHTADYSTYVATCCSDTGLSRHIELKYLEEARLQNIVMQDRI